MKTVNYQLTVKNCALPNLLWIANLTFVLYLYTGYQPVMAQSCFNLSDQPLFFESFGSGGQRPVLSGKTSYEYQNGNCPQDGQYKIVDFIDGTCFDSVWHYIPEDHTPGDTRGNMLLFNGGYDVNEFYNQAVSGLCPGTTYEFSFWSSNLLRPDKNATGRLPNLTAQLETLNGQIIQTTAIGSIPATAKPVWTRYALLFTPPDTVSQLTIHLITGKGGSGNDFVIDDIQVNQCGSCAPTSLYVPDAFTPNNDGMNDEFSIFVREPSAFDLKIFNRWGNLIFTSNALNDRWNGTYAGNLCPSGEYTWTITYQTANQPRSVNRYSRTGRVLLIR